MLFLALLLPAIRPVLTSTITVSVPLTASTPTPTVPASFISFSLEGDRWTDWVGTTSRNQFTFNALNNLKSLTGTPPNIRVGADSEDRTTFDPSVQFVSEGFPAAGTSVPFPEASAVSVGDGYYAASQFLPSGTHVTWGVNFGANNVTTAINEAQSILKAFKSSAITTAGISLDFIEIGNEPDLYGGNGKRTGTWNIQTYVTQWESFAQSVASAIGLKAGVKPTFQGLAFAASDHGAGGFSPQRAYTDGLLNSTAGKLIGIISQHKYSGGCCTALVQDLMSKSFIRGNLTVYGSDATATLAQGLAFVFGETNSYFNHGVPRVSDAAGAAVWVVDYSLFGATLGISGMFFHHGVGYKYNFFQPVSLNRSTEDGTPLNPPSPPHIQATYYGAIVVAEFLGTVSPRVVKEITFSSGTMSGYALYGAGGALKKVLLVNSQAFLTSQTTRPSNTVFFNFGTGGPTNMVLKRLSIPHADVLTGLTWGGQSYETSDALVSGTLHTTSSAVSAGVTISATEVVLVTFQ